MVNTVMNCKVWEVLLCQKIGVFLSTASIALIKRLTLTRNIG